LLEMPESDFWPVFETLVTGDSSGAYVRTVVDSCAVLDDVSGGMDIVADAVEREPEHVDWRVRYAVLLLLDGLSDAAADELEAAEEMTDDSVVIADIERLLLQANGPEFETHLGDITAVLGANRPLGRRDVQFLENAIDQAPT